MRKCKLANRVRDFRKLAGLTQSELGTLLCVSINTISSIERGVWSPSAELAYSMCRLFSCKFEDIFYIVDLDC